MIWGILATISIVVLGFSILPSVWFWVCWEVVAAGFVAFGCFGEWYLFKTPAKPGHQEKHRRRELQFILLVAIGVTMELMGLAHAIPEAMRLERDVAEAKHQTEELRKSNLALEAIIAPRSLSPDQQRQLVDALKRFSKHIVVIESYSLDAEAIMLSTQIGAILEKAGITVIDARASKVTAGGGFEVGVNVRGENLDFVKTFVNGLVGCKLQASDNPAPLAVPRVVMGNFVAAPPGATAVMVGVKPLPPITIVR